MGRRNLQLFVAAMVIVASACFASPAKAQYGRQYYSSWSYYRNREYYYQYYCYKPYSSYSGYAYHYCIYYPKYPSYVYYYNPYSRVYWGRYDCESKGYSLLDAKDRKANLKDIPDSAFPKPGKMPAIPESTDGATITPPAPPPPPDKSAPGKDAPPKDGKEGPAKGAPAKDAP